MKIKSLLSIAFAVLCVAPAMAQSKTVTTTAAGTLATSLTEEEKGSVKELVISGPINKSDFNFINTLAKLESLDLKGATIAEETIESRTYPADELPKEAINSNKVINKLVLPASITSIGEDAICFCDNLVTVDFSACTKLKTIKFQGVYSNKMIAPIDLSGLTSLEVIEENGFNATSGSAPELAINLSGCSSLKELGKYAFGGKRDIKVTIDFSGCTALTTIGESAFQNVGVENVDLTACTALETLSKKAFYCGVASKAKMTTLKLPANLKTIGEQAFDNQKLTTVSILAVTPPTLSTKKPFYPSAMTTATLTVPKGAKAAYEANEEWKKFGTIVESDGSSVNEFEAAKAVIWGADNTVYVKNAESGTVVNVYDLTGAVVASGVADGDLALQVAAKGVYIVKAGKAVAKVRL